MRAPGYGAPRKITAAAKRRDKGEKFAMLQTIQSLWIGKRLTNMERISIQSFLAHGHEYHLYTYGPVDGAPPGAIVKDAAAILPESMVFEYKEHPSVAGCSNFFRYKMLLEHGGWWVDTDVVCIKPFDFPGDHVFATERDQSGREFVTSGIIKAPRGSRVMEDAWAICQSKTPQGLRWGETGPELMHRLVFRTGLASCAKSADVFCPIDPARFFEATVPRNSHTFPPATHGVHLWNELWRRVGLDKDETYAPKSLYEHFKKAYLVKTSAPPASSGACG
jgi:hypothetical protein